MTMMAIMQAISSILKRRKRAMRRNKGKHENIVKVIELGRKIRGLSLVIQQFRLQVYSLSCLKLLAYQIHAPTMSS